MNKKNVIFLITCIFILLSIMLNTEVRAEKNVKIEVPENILNGLSTIYFSPDMYVEEEGKIKVTEGTKGILISSEGAEEGNLKGYMRKEKGEGWNFRISDPSKMDTSKTYYMLYQYGANEMTHYLVKIEYKENNWTITEIGKAEWGEDEQSAYWKFTVLDNTEGKPTLPTELTGIELDKLKIEDKEEPEKQPQEENEQLKFTINTETAIKYSLFAFKKESADKLYNYEEIENKEILTGTLIEPIYKTKDENDTNNLACFYQQKVDGGKYSGEESKETNGFVNIKAGETAKIASNLQIEGINNIYMIIGVQGKEKYAVVEFVREEGKWKINSKKVAEWLVLEGTNDTDIWRITDVTTEVNNEVTKGITIEDSTKTIKIGEIIIKEETTEDVKLVYIRKTSTDDVTITLPELECTGGNIIEQTAEGKITITPYSGSTKVILKDKATGKIEKTWVYENEEWEETTEVLDLDNGSTVEDNSNDKEGISFTIKTESEMKFAYHVFIDVSEKNDLYNYEDTDVVENLLNEKERIIQPFDKDKYVYFRTKEGNENYELGWVKLPENSSTEIFVDNLDKLSEDIKKIYMIIGTASDDSFVILTISKSDWSGEWECDGMGLLNSEWLNLDEYSDIWKISTDSSNKLTNNFTYSTKDKTLTIEKV